MLSDYGNNPIRENRDDDPFSQTLWHYDSAGRLLAQEGAQPGNEGDAGIAQATRWIILRQKRLSITG